MMNTVTIYVELLEEGTPTIRGTEAIPLGNDTYKLLPTPDYDPEDEIWQFLPESIVKAKLRLNFGEMLLVATEQIY